MRGRGGEGGSVIHMTGSERAMSTTHTVSLRMGGNERAVYERVARAERAIREQVPQIPDAERAFR